MKKGDTVVCIDGSFSPIQRREIPHLPRQGKYYTIRDHFVATRNGTASLQAVHLNEKHNPPLPHPSGMGMFEPSFSAERFKVVDDSYERVDQEAEVLEAI